MTDTAEPGWGGWGETTGLDLRSWLLAIRRQWWLVVLGVVAGAVAGLVVAAVQGPRHVASETVRVTPHPAPGEAPAHDPEVLAAELDQLVYELRSPTLEERVSARLGGVPVALTSGTAEESMLVTVEAMAPTPDEAADAAARAVDLVVERRRAAAIAEAEETATRLRERARELAAMASDVADQVPATVPAGETATTARLRRRVEILLDQQADYERRATDLEIAGQTTPIGLERVHTGPAPATPAAPTRIDLVLLLAAVGAIAALAWTWLVEQRHGPRVTRHWLARRVRAEVADVNSPVGLEVLAMSLVDRPGGVRPALGYLQVGTGRVDLQTGPMAFARAMVAVGRPVTVVDGDLRTAGDGRRSGLASYLGGAAGAEELVDAVRAGDPSSPRVLASDDQPPASPLRAARTTPLLPLFEALSALSDVVVVVPDPIARPEAVLLLADTAGVVLEVEPGLLRRRRLARVVQRLESAGLAVVGVVTTVRRAGPDRLVAVSGASKRTGTGRTDGTDTWFAATSTTVRRVESTNRRRPGGDRWLRDSRGGASSGPP